MGFDILALVAIVLLVPFALYGAWAMRTNWRMRTVGRIGTGPGTAPAAAPSAPPDPWQSLPLAIAGFDAEDRLVGASRAFREELGVRNVALDDVLRPGIAAEALFDAWTQRSGGTISPITAIATLPAHELIWPTNGNRTPHRLACVALHDAAGLAYRLLVDPAILNAAPIMPMQESAADARAIVARNAVLASALSSITIGVALCDATSPEATILYVNPAFGRITGYELQEVIGQPLRFLQARGTPPDQIERLERALIQRRAANLLLRSQRKDGKPFWNDMHVNPILEDGGHVAHFVAFITDASPRIRSEENLREAKHQAEIANRAKSDFLANVSHELRTPLNAIIGFSEIMQMQMFGAMGHKQYAAYADDIHSSGKHLLSIINDILDLSKIEAGRYQLHIDSVDVEETFEDCARLVRERAENAGLQIVRQIDPATPRLLADKRAVKQILINLLSNAIKFTPQGGEVTLTARPGGAPGWVALSVSDTGIGIPPEQLDNALSAFGQVDNPFTRSQEGTGLGLPIVKSLVELHSGQFSIESAVGKGTTVTMVLPAHKMEASSRKSDADVEAAHGS
ncbi:MAG TPA: PAS domain-containing sensor histidine kinase [Dongiaceae bacterium]|jgi:PAS domain S-box-containing protein|nr:PAS domain-containing sensor histidine kinase [Dongiaceae bacterium]